MTLSNRKEIGKLFVGGLSWESSKESLQQYFSQFGEITDSIVIKNKKTGCSRGFGFVTFKDKNCISKVLASGPHELDGRTIDPKCCSPQNMRKARKRDHFPKVFLGGLPDGCTETNLQEFFSIYGKVMEVIILYDQKRKKSRGFGFLSFESKESVDKLCTKHYVIINNKKVECKRAESRNIRSNNNCSSNLKNIVPVNIGNQENLKKSGGSNELSKIIELMSNNFHPIWNNPQQNPYGANVKGYNWNESTSRFNYCGCPNSSYKQNFSEGYSDYGPTMNYGWNECSSVVPTAPSAVLSSTYNQKSENLSTSNDLTLVGNSISCTEESTFANSVSYVYCQINRFNNGSQEKINGVASAFHPYRRIR